MGAALGVALAEASGLGLVSSGSARSTAVLALALALAAGVGVVDSGLAAIVGDSLHAANTPGPRANATKATRRLLRSARTAGAAQNGHVRAWARM